MLLATIFQSVSSNEIIGNIQPDWVRGINNRLTFKNVALSFLIDVKQGGDLFNLDLYAGLARACMKKLLYSTTKEMKCESSQRGWWSPRAGCAG